MPQMQRTVQPQSHPRGFRGALGGKFQRTPSTEGKVVKGQVIGIEKDRRSSMSG